MTSQFSLASVLRSMGMTDAFSRSADFSGMSGRRDLYISAVIHQAYVDVNEEGTEAAAATAVTMKLLSAIPAPTPVFKADHPFVFVIRDNNSGSILFIGRVMNPNASA
jgi:serpin B